MIITNRKTLFLSKEEVKEAIVDYISNKLNDKVAAAYLKSSNAIIVSGGSKDHEFIVSILDSETRTVESNGKEDHQPYEDDEDLYEFGCD